MHIFNYFLYLFLTIVIVSCSSGSSKSYQGPGEYQFLGGEATTKTVINSNGYAQLSKIYFKPTSKIKEFRGFLRSTSLYNSPKFYAGHLIFKSGEEYKGTFYNGKYSGLGWLKKNGVVENGVFLDGKLVEKLDIDLNFDFDKMIDKIGSKKESYFDNGFGITVSPFTYGQASGSRHQGWATRFDNRESQQYTANVPNWVIFTKSSKLLIKETFPAYLATKEFADIRVNHRYTNYESGGTYTQTPVFYGCANFMIDDRLVKAKYPYGSGWRLQDGEVFYVAERARVRGRLEELPKEHLNDNGSLKLGLRTRDDFKIQSKRGRVTIIFDNYAEYFSEYRNAVISQAKNDKFICIGDGHQEKIAKYIATLERDTAESLVALRPIIANMVKNREAEKQRKKKARWKAAQQKYAKISSPTTINEHWSSTSSCSSPRFNFNTKTLTCSGKNLSTVMVKLREAKSSYLILTQNGLVPISPFFRSENSPTSHVHVFAAHPNLANRAAHTCNTCRGNGFTTSIKQSKTRLSPLHKYRNGLKVTTTTTVTSNQKRYDGLCPVCNGHGKVPVGWARGR